MSDTMLQKFKHIFRINMFIGLIVTIVATYMIITGSYEGLQSRETTESILGWTAIAGILYTVSFWFACLFREQFFQSPSKES